jgi:hypothetical protein
MIDVFHAIAACDDLIHYWDVAKHAGGGVLLRASSQQLFPSETDAVEVAREITRRIGPAGYGLQTVSATARSANGPGGGWHAFVEVVIAASVGTATS